ncbi:MAG: YfcE family phosphodiesterase [Clostridia bacterium]|nr:YfcE family phosphodiesterase [Clostridia bacterium]
MKIIVFSDSHRDLDAMRAAVDETSPGMIIHLGDHIDDAAALEMLFPDIPLESVRGNTDLWSPGPGEKILEIDGIRIFMTHGDMYDVRNGTSAILAEGIRRKAGIVLFGHTHNPYLKTKKGIVLMNPGKAGRRARGMSEPSFGIIETDGGIRCGITRLQDIIGRSGN